MPDPLVPNFNVQSGLCNQNGRVALDASAPAPVQEAFIVDQLTGSAQIAAAAKQALPACAHPVSVSNVPYKGPGSGRR